MWRKIRPLFVILSVTLNAAFAATWIAYALPAHLECVEPCANRGDKGPVWCPLHREIGTSEKQWQEIEPRLIELQRSTRTVCRQINRRRLEMLDLIAAPQPDREAIRAKQEQILSGQRKVQELVIAHLLTEKRMLTPKQQTQFFKLIRERAGCAAHGPLMGPSLQGGFGKSPRPLDNPNGEAR